MKSRPASKPDTDMRRSDLGEFEEVVLLTVAALSPGAYSVAIAEELEQATGRPRQHRSGTRRPAATRTKGVPPFGNGRGNGRTRRTTETLFYRNCPRRARAQRCARCTHPALGPYSANYPARMAISLTSERAARTCGQRAKERPRRRVGALSLFRSFTLSPFHSLNHETSPTR